MPLGLLATALLAVPVVWALLLCARRLGRERRYAALLGQCLARQPEHEREHAKAHPRGGAFTQAMRIESVARRLERKIHAAGLPPLSLEERRRRALEALCRSRS